MSERKSLMDALVDQACGLVPESAFAKWSDEHGITLECVTCGRTKRTSRMKSDPKNAVKAVFPCPVCWPSGHKSIELKYYDKDGNQVVPAWEAQG